MAKNKADPSKAASKTSQKKKREVQVVSCPSAFPYSTSTITSSTSKKRSRDSNDDVVVGRGGENRSQHQHQQQQHQYRKRKSGGGLLDWDETVKEVRGFGATAFSGKQKRDYDDEQYFALTGRHKKKQKVPLPIVRGIKKAAAKRQAKLKQEAREAGIVLPKSTTAKEQKGSKSDSTIRSYGPAPNIGFMKGGVYRVSNNKNGDKKNKNSRC